MGPSSTPNGRDDYSPSINNRNSSLNHHRHHSPDVAYHDDYYYTQGTTSTRNDSRFGNYRENDGFGNYSSNDDRKHHQFIRYSQTFPPAASHQPPLPPPSLPPLPSRPSSKTLSCIPPFSPYSRSSVKPTSTETYDSVTQSPPHEYYRRRRQSHYHHRHHRSQQQHIIPPVTSPRSDHYDYYYNSQNNKSYNEWYANDNYGEKERDSIFSHPERNGESHISHRRIISAHPEHRISLSQNRSRTARAILRKKFTWKHYPELEAFLIQNREEYLRHSALNYTAQQKKYNNRLTERILDLADQQGYVFDEDEFDFVTVRDRIRCYYKSYVQSSKKRGTFVGYGCVKKTALKKNHDNHQNDKKKDNDDDNGKSKRDDC